MKPSHRRRASVLFVASVALCMAIGGVGYAAAAKVDTRDLAKGAVTAKKLDKNAVTTKKIKKQAVNGSKVADDSLTGRQISESTLSLVPSANHANSADQATSANNATHADTATTADNGAVEFSFFGTANDSATMLSVQGAQFQAACTGGALDFNATRIRATADNGITKVTGVDEGQTAFSNSDDDFDAGDATPLLAGNTTSAQREVGAQADYAGFGKTPIVNANYASEESGTLPVGADCAIWGTANVIG